MIKLKTAGTKITTVYYFEEGGLHRFYLDDPFENVIEVIDVQINA